MPYHMPNYKCMGHFSDFYNECWKPRIILHFVLICFVFSHKIPIRLIRNVCMVLNFRSRQRWGTSQRLNIIVTRFVCAPRGKVIMISLQWTTWSAASATQRSRIASTRRHRLKSIRFWIQIIPFPPSLWIPRKGLSWCLWSVIVSEIIVWSSWSRMTLRHVDSCLLAPQRSWAALSKAEIEGSAEWRPDRSR